MKLLAQLAVAALLKAIPTVQRPVALLDLTLSFLQSLRRLEISEHSFSLELMIICTIRFGAMDRLSAVVSALETTRPEIDPGACAVCLLVARYTHGSNISSTCAVRRGPLHADAPCKCQATTSEPPMLELF